MLLPLIGLQAFKIKARPHFFSSWNDFGLLYLYIRRLTDVVADIIWLKLSEILNDSLGMYLHRMDPLLCKIESNLDRYMTWLDLMHVPSNIFGERTPCKKCGWSPPYTWLFTTKEQFFRGQQNLSSLHKIGWRSAEKAFPFLTNMHRYLCVDISLYGRLFVTIRRQQMTDGIFKSGLEHRFKSEEFGFKKESSNFIMLLHLVT
jgi:hypothetical protein